MTVQSTSGNVLLVDAWNLFIRSYAAYPSMTTNGEQIGGAVGFIKTITHLVKSFSPHLVCIVWESGGSPRRRRLYSEYKRGSRPMKLNRYYEDDLPDTVENKIQQVRILTKLLACMPVCQVHVPDCEGDDIIAHLVSHKFKDECKIIVSTDRDYYQLLREDIKVYNPTKKALLTEKDVMSEFNVSARNFALAKSVCGDSSDNVPGVKGFGYKTISKKFPILMSSGTILVEDLISYAAARRDESSYYGRLFEEADDVRRNWKLVHLDTSALSAYQIQRIDYAVDTFKAGLDKMKFVKMLSDEGIQGLNIEEVCYTFVKLNKA